MERGKQRISVRISEWENGRSCSPRCRKNSFGERVTTFHSSDFSGISPCTRWDKSWDFGTLPRSMIMASRLLQFFLYSNTLFKDWTPQRNDLENSQDPWAFRKYFTKNTRFKMTPLVGNHQVWMFKTSCHIWWREKIKILHLSRHTYRVARWTVSVHYQRGLKNNRFLRSEDI